MFKPEMNINNKHDHEPRASQLGKCVYCHPVN